MKFPMMLAACVLIFRTAFASEAIDVAVFEYIGCALYEDGAVYCWGHFPVEGHDVPPFRAKRIESLPPAVSVAAGRFGACAVDEKAVLWCWGADYQRSVRENRYIASMEPFMVEGLPPIRAATLGYNHMCALSRDGEVWCWGENPRGEVGSGDQKPKGEPFQVMLPEPAQSVSAGINNTCAVLESHQVACWGSDNPTRQGRAFVYESTKPVFLDPAQFGLFDNVANGRNFACGIRNDGRVTCWGSNVMGQLGTTKPRVGQGVWGVGDVRDVRRAEDLDADYFYACAVTNGRVYCWGNVTFADQPRPGLGGTVPAQVSGITGATRVGIGPIFACAVDAGRVLCWGLQYEEGTQTAVIEGMRPDKTVLVPGLPK
jgi:alpha-tubulin suppressor-like RCC1 family protein